MLKRINLLPEPVEDQKAFILDHGKTDNDGQLKYADDLQSYGWSIRQYGKLKAGAYVLNRHPGKITKDRRFEIYSGGYVESVSEPDDAGNVTAVITHAFTIEPPIRQGDSFIENFGWKTPNKKKRKKPNSWGNFWDQYGMNEITYADFFALIENQHCIPVNDFQLLAAEPDLTEAELEKIKKENANGFTVTLDEIGPKHSKNTRKAKFIAKKIDFERVNRAKQKIGALGEEIVFDFLSQEAVKYNLTQPVHVSKEEGDGLGYDIRAWNKEENEVHIEVKASTSKYSDGFEMTPNEIEASLRDTSYKIYFVHDLDVKTKECKIKIYEGPITERAFKLVPSSYKIYHK